MRFGYRFMAPFVRKLLDAQSPAQVHTLRLACAALSWLLVHAEAEGNTILEEALRPLAMEWTLRALARGACADSTAAVCLLAANCGCLVGEHANAQLFAGLRTPTVDLQEPLKQRVEGDMRRGGMVTTKGCEGIAALGFELPVTWPGWPEEDYSEHEYEGWEFEGDCEENYDDWELDDDQQALDHEAAIAANCLELPVPVA